MYDKCGLGCVGLHVVPKVGESPNHHAKEKGDLSPKGKEDLRWQLRGAEGHESVLQTLSCCRLGCLDGAVAVGSWTALKAI